MKIFSSILFGGEALQAAEYYAKIFDAKLQVVKYSDIPNLPTHLAEAPTMVARATIVGEDFELAVSDVSELIGKTSDWHTRLMRLTVVLDSVQEAQRVYSLLAKQAKSLNVPFMSTPYAKGFGLLIDKYNVEWEICGELM